LNGLSALIPAILVLAESSYRLFQPKILPLHLHTNLLPSSPTSTLP
jgi:hypothetical protein